MIYLMKYNKQESKENMSNSFIDKKGMLHVHIEKLPDEWAKNINNTILWGDPKGSKHDKKHQKSKGKLSKV